MQINQYIQKGKKQLAILIDPDKEKSETKLLQLIHKVNILNPSFIFIGGSTVDVDDFKQCIKIIKNNSSIPLIIFPGSHLQIDKNADAILFLSLISGRNPDFLISHQIEAAPIIKSSNLKAIPTAYMLIDGGKTSSVAYVSQTSPIPSDQYVIAKNTAMAGELLGMQTIFMDAGSGAITPVPPKMIQAVASSTSLPLIIGGGLTSLEDINKAYNAGADVVVIGNKIETDINFLLDLKNINFVNTTNH
ncbi:MAG TPA: geranylgeranylglyceryl/heptaprenylglyceryl phosphate synthase [Crocinitomix sp.]|nr:geranylgeranylglyceryl/heptaprenylglyceryl phosphate synthase [Crocinitomix sp.]